MLLSLSAFNLLRAVSAYRQWKFLGELPLSVPPAYLLATGAVWAVVLSALAAGLWRRQGWARLGLLAAFPLYVAQGWFERLVLARSDYSRATFGWSLLLDVVSLMVVGYTLVLDRSWSRPSAKTASPALDAPPASRSDS